MKHNSTEQQIKAQFQAREIQPSAQSWDRLDAMLTVAEEKTNKRPFLWLYVAAAILVFFCVGLFFYQNQNPASQAVPTVAGQDTKNVQPKTATPNRNAQPFENRQETVAESETRPLKNTPAAPHRSQFQNGDKPMHQEPATHQEKWAEKQNGKLQPKAELDTPNQALAVQLPKTTPTTQESVKDKPEPSQAIAAQQFIADRSKVKVSANSLLSQVDGELELTFREKVFKTVSKNYKEVKVALANRNQE